MLNKFSIYVPIKRTFNLIADGFPKLVTLLFNNINTITISVTEALMKMKISVVFSLKNKITITSAINKLKMYMVNTIAPMKYKITYTFKSIVRQTHTFNLIFTMTSDLKSRVKISFNTLYSIAISASAMVGVFRLFGDMDNNSFSTYDNMTLSDVDFIKQ